MNLKEKRSGLIDAAKAIVDKAIVENRAMTQDEKTDYDAKLAEAETLKATIEAEDRAAKLAAELRAPSTPSIVVNPGETRSATADAEQRSAFVHALRTGEHRAGLTTAGQGTYLVPVTLAQKITSVMKTYGGLRMSRAQVVTGNGQTVNYTISNDTTNEGRMIAANTQPNLTAATLPTLSQKPLAVFNFTSDIIPVDISLLQDSSYDLESFVNDTLGIRLGKATNRKFTLGAAGGASEPEGIVNAAQVGVTSASATAITFNEINNLLYSVDVYYRANGEWMLSDATLSAIMGLTDTLGRPIFSAPVAGAPGTILGRPYVINNHMDGIGASAKPLLFGDFSQYVIKDVPDSLYVKRLEELYATSGQVGFMLLSRHGGILVNDGSAVKALQCAAS